MFVPDFLDSSDARKPAGTVIIGGGPAGMGAVLAASRRGDLQRLLADGLTIVERGTEFGAGALGGYAAVSDSSADTFLAGVRDHPMPCIARLADRPEARALAAREGGHGVPLAEAGAFLGVLGAELARVVREGGGRTMSCHDALGATRTTGGWLVRVRRHADGAVFDIPARALVIATGGEQPQDRLGSTMFAGATLAARCGSRLVRSHDVLTEGGVDRIVRRLSGVGQPRIGIIGSSTSAVTAASMILKSPLGARLPERGLTILHRRKLRPFYPSAAAAMADGFTDFGARDVCPLSGFVYRLAGFRTEARELLLHALGVNGRAPDPRLHLHQVTPSNERASLRRLAEADIVIGALGYRPRALPLHDEFGAPLPLAASRPGGLAMVDDSCRVLDAQGRAVPGVFGIGLAAGFVPTGKLGGEASFRGQANGLWLWQNAVGASIVDQILPAAEVRMRAAA